LAEKETKRGGDMRDEIRMEQNQGISLRIIEILQASCCKEKKSLSLKDKLTIVKMLWRKE